MSNLQFVIKRTPLRSGQSIFSRPKPIDLSSSRRRPYTLDIDMEDDEAPDDLNRPLIRNTVVFDANGDDPAATPSRGRMSDMPRAAQAVRDRDTEDVWAELS